MRWVLPLLTGVLAAGLLSPLAAAQSPAETVIIDDFVVYRVQYGYSYRGNLDRAQSVAEDGSRVELWAFEGRVGDCVAISMTSQSFSPFLQLVSRSPMGEVVERGRGGPTASIRSELETSGRYFVVASSAGAGQRSGSYSLLLRRCN